MTDDDKGNLSDKISNILEQAKEAGASVDQLAEIRHMFKTQTDWHPTKKRPTDEQRKKKRKMQKESRKANRDPDRKKFRGQQRGR